ncbi:MAG TPA: prepilin peptidase [Candidatus Paceibacterota bacterium]|nr:prepilin peptidase [Candidatus Paceibacterota bacterium]
MGASLFVLTAIGLFLFGLIIGSFLNVLIIRYRTGRSLSGRSGCLSCGVRLSPLELVPVVSWLFLRGRCRSCRSPISPQYPLVEMATGLLFLGSLALFDVSHPSVLLLGGLVSYLIASSALVALVAYDIRHQIIPDPFVALFALAALFLHLFEGASVTPYLLAGAALATPFAALWYFSEGRWMGFGDAKLAFGIGLLLGLAEGLSAIILGFWMGALFGLLLILLGKVGARLSLGGVPLTMKSEVPFAPFLVAGALLVLFTHFSLFDQELLSSLL